MRDKVGQRLLRHFGAMRRVLRTFAVLLTVTTTGACAQDSGLSLEQRLMQGHQIQPIDSLGVQRFVDEVSPVRTDSAEVYFNVRGEPVAWRAWLGGEYHVFWKPYGHYVVSDSAVIALDVFKKDRKLLEMLEGLDLVEAAAKKIRSIDDDR